MDQRAKRLAEVIVKYSLALKKGDKLFMTGSEAVIPFMKEVYKQAIDVGAYPLIQVAFEDMNEYRLTHGSDEQIMYVPASTVALVETYDAMLTVMGTRNAKTMSNIDSQKLRMRALGNKPINEILGVRKAKGDFKWCATLFPTDADAQEANMSLADYEDFVYKACFVDEEDAIEKWKAVSEQQERICRILDTKKRIRIVSKDTDISMSVEGRRWVNCCGKVNFPDGEVFTGPIEDSVEGYIRFSFPAIHMGKEVEDIRLRFEKGKLVEATAAKGEDFLRTILDSDEGSRYVGEIAVGTNYGIDKFTKKILFDEKIGGTVHMAMGRSIPESKGQNKSLIHWDMLCDMSEGGEIYADGELIYKDSKFLL